MGHPYWFGHHGTVNVLLLLLQQRSDDAYSLLAVLPFHCSDYQAY